MHEQPLTPWTFRELATIRAGSFRTDVRGTLTILTGVHTGRLVALDEMPFRVGHAADAHLVVDDVGVSHDHVRIAKTPDGVFYAEDIASTQGTFLHAISIGIALLREGDRLRLGPEFELRFGNEAIQKIGHGAEEPTHHGDPTAPRSRR
jgi:pSer/pThr/pTyr-binding forkhead associated (FHA) protein